jgi:aspartate/methionine/tyrosine aminotransferase
MKQATRMADIRPFYVMEILARAQQLQAQGCDVIHMEVGEPDFPTPPIVLEAAANALRGAGLGYTPAAGLPELRRAIVAHYQVRYGLDIDHRRIFVTPGASGALQMVLTLLVEPGAGVALADPGYPCYPNLTRCLGGIPRWLAVDETSDFNLCAAVLATAWDSTMTGLIAASPANPTGSIMKPDVLRELIDFAAARGAFVVSDEIYQGLEYDGLARSALAYSRDVFVINSFSKYFGMTGWRLGWAVVPEPAIDGAERLAQNLFISAPTLSQRAALAAFEPENMRELERRRQVFAARREVLCAGLSRLGFAIRARPQGAFYVYADAGGLTTDTQAFAMNLLELAGVAVTPGRDFGIHHPERFLRFCYTAPVERIEEALARLERFIRERA